MTLSHADIARIEDAGYRDFYHEVDGFLELKNIDNHCFFLRGKDCIIYPLRPEGCRIYPLVYQVDSGFAIWHDFCKYRSEFEYRPENEERLRELIEIEDRERRERLQERQRSLR